MTIRWQDLSTNETGFLIEHQVQVASAWQPSGTYTVGPGREQVLVTITTGQHRFRVIAFNGGGYSRAGDWSTPVEVTDPVEPDPDATPAAPTNLRLEHSGSEGVVVRWNDVSLNETGFEIERDPVFTGGGTRTVAANVAVYNDASGVGTFRYRVRSFNTYAASAWTPWEMIVVTEAAPAAPTSLLAYDAGNERDVTLSWHDNSDNEEEFVVERQEQVGAMWGPVSEFIFPANTTAAVNEAGTGTYRYRIAARNGIGTSSWTAWVSASVTDGWTRFTPSSDTRIVYVSSSQGSDSNDGLSADRPKRTIAAGYAVLRHGYPDWLLLKRGDVWDESLGHWKKCGRSATERMVVNSYGTAAARPLLRTGTGNGLTRQGGGGSPDSIDHLALVGIHFVPHLRDGGVTGIRWIGPGRDLLIEDCKFERYGNNLSLQGYNGRIEGIMIRRCVIVDAYDVGSHSQGVFISAADGLLIEESVFDHNGWHETIAGAEPTIFNHNLYLATTNTDVIVRNNLIARGSSHGVQLRSGGHLIGNVSVRNAIGMLLGGGTTHPDTHTYGVTGSVVDNVVLEGTDITSSLPRGYGIDLTNIGMAGAEVRNNVIAHKYTSSGASAIQLLGDGAGSGVGCNNVTITGNLLYDWRGPLWITQPPSSPPSPSTFASVSGIEIFSNMLQEPDSNANGALVRTFATEPCTLGNNTYSSANSANEWFRVGTRSLSFNQWIAEAEDNNSEVETVAYPDPNRSLATYAQVVGVGSTLEAFLNAARNQSRQNWREDLTAQAIRAYIREGFGLPD